MPERSHDHHMTKPFRVHATQDAWLDAGRSIHEAWGPRPDDAAMVLHPRQIEGDLWATVRRRLAGWATDQGHPRVHIRKLNSQWIVVTLDEYPEPTDQWFGVLEANNTWTLLGAS